MKVLVSVGSSGFWFCSSVTRSWRKSVVSSALELDDEEVLVAVETDDVLTALMLMANLGR
jgi:hypothetical protein